MNDSKSTVKSYVSSPASLISFMENSCESWCIKDQHSQYIYMNRMNSDELNLPEKFKCEGKLDREIPAAPCEELWEEFVDLDQKTIAENRRVSFVQVHHYGKNNFENFIPQFAEKMPLYDNQNKIIGVVSHAMMIDAPTLLFYMRRLNKKTIQFDAPNDLFTPRELDIIFWAQQRLTAKEIAKRLNLSPRTVENRLQFIYEKAGVHSVIQFVEYCQHVGLDSYVPSSFIRKGVQLIE